MGWAREAPREKLPVLSEAPVADAETELVELDDVPAAVVCAHCGSVDCLGECVDLDETTHASKVIAIVPWERPVGGWLARLWSTSRLTTLNHTAFFGSLPAGDIGAAATFALLAELVAVTSHAALGASVLALSFPDIAASIVRDPELFAATARGACVAVPGVALLMVFLHGLHGLILDWAAARWGGRKRLGLRFGLYSCGWDVVTLPLGLVVLAISAGPVVALRTAPLGVALPPRAAQSYLKGVHRLEDEPARQAGWLASALTGLTALACCIAALLILVVAMVRL